jgi:hypothetical protein
MENENVEKEQICDQCGETRKESEMTHTQIDGRKVWVCDSCKEILHVCDYCGEYCTQTAKVDGHGYVCDLCLEESFTTCDYCGEYTHIDNVFGVEPDITVCEDCAYDHTSVCANCGYRYDNEEGTWCEDRDEWLCDVCYDDIGMRLRKEHADRYFDQADLVPTDTFRTFGVELEGLVDDEIDMGSEVMRRFRAVSDGSLPDNGVEFVSVPLQNPSAFKLLHKFQREVAKDNLSVSTLAGMHIHMYIHPHYQTGENLARIMRLYMILEDDMFKLVSQSRQSNGYCRKLGKRYEISNFRDIHNLFEFATHWYRERIYDRSDIPTGKYHDSRYSWVNFHPMFYQNTIEIRLHQATFNSRKISYWYQLNRDIMKYALTHTDEEVDNMTWEKFVAQEPKNVRAYIYKRQAEIANILLGAIWDYPQITSRIGALGNIDWLDTSRLKELIIGMEKQICVKYTL